MRKIYTVGLIILLLMLLGCSTLQTVQPTATPSTSATSLRTSTPSSTAKINLPSPSPQFISEQKAIERAGPNCGNSHLRPLQTPSNVRAQLMSIKKAEEYSGIQINCQCSDSTNVTVWIVEMDGMWQLQSGPEPTATAIGQSNTPIPTRTPAPSACYLIVNAITGSPLGSVGKRK